MIKRMTMPDLTNFFRINRPAHVLPLLVAFALASPAAAEDAPLPYELTATPDTRLADGIEEEPRAIFRTPISTRISCCRVGATMMTRTPTANGRATISPSRRAC